MPKITVTETYTYEIDADNEETALNAFEQWAGDGMPDDNEFGFIFIDNQTDATTYN